MDGGIVGSPIFCCVRRCMCCATGWDPTRRRIWPRNCRSLCGEYTSKAGFRRAHQCIRNPRGPSLKGSRQPFIMHHYPTRNRRFQRSSRCCSVISRPERLIMSWVQCAVRCARCGPEGLQPTFTQDRSSVEARQSQHPKGTAPSGAPRGRGQLPAQSRSLTSWSVTCGNCA